MVSPTRMVTSRSTDHQAGDRSALFDVWAIDNKSPSTALLASSGLSVAMYASQMQRQLQERKYNS